MEIDLRLIEWADFFCLLFPHEGLTRDKIFKSLNTRGLIKKARLSRKLRLLRFRFPAMPRTSNAHSLNHARASLDSAASFGSRMSYRPSSCSFISSYAVALVSVEPPSATFSHPCFLDPRISSLPNPLIPSNPFLNLYPFHPPSNPTRTKKIR